MPELTAEEELDVRFLSAVRALPGGSRGGQADPAAPVTAGRLSGIAVNSVTPT